MAKQRKPKIALTPEQVTTAKYAKVEALKLAAKASRDVNSTFDIWDNSGRFANCVGNGDSVTVYDDMNGTALHFEVVELDDVQGFFLVEWSDLNGLEAID